MVLHQVELWYCPYLSNLGTNMLLSLLTALAATEWPDLLRLATSALRFLSSPRRLLVAVCSAMLPASLVEMWLAYSFTC